MPRMLKVAVIQMYATPAPVAERLDRAADLIAEAASAGAKLIILPEVFNTGYEYHERNYSLAEPINGKTVKWMKSQANLHKIHLMGSLLMLDEEDVYNTALLFAPDGRMWRYDKNYPFLWERAYFREGRKIMVADTDLGKFGMMICWDTAHADLWDRYSGKIDAMLISSCPPKVDNARYIFPDGTSLDPQDLGMVGNTMRGEDYFYGRDLEEHAAWMKVPVLYSQGNAHTFRSKLPMAGLTLGTMVAARPELWRRALETPDVEIEAEYDLATRIIDANGQVAASVDVVGDGFTLAEIPLADSVPQPEGNQPPMRTPAAAYFMVDAVGSGLATLTYRQGLRQELGSRMAPVDPRTKIWAGVIAAAVAVGVIAGRLLKR
jgi:predicted amidohydrolase